MQEGLDILLFRNLILIREKHKNYDPFELLFNIFFSFVYNIKIRKNPPLIHSFFVNILLKKWELN